MNNIPTGLRIARPSDAAAILDIYAPYIRDTSLTFELEVPGVKEFSERIDHYLQLWPWIVFEDQGRIFGYAYASRHRERLGYQWCVESSVYLHKDQQGKGIGTLLYQALFGILKFQGFRNVYAVINLPNEKSIIMHERCEFKWFATYENVGYKLGQWKNVGWWKLQLNEYTDEPVPPLKFAELKEDIVNAILLRSSVVRP